jgi:hypothetical protein
MLSKNIFVFSNPLYWADVLFFYIKKEPDPDLKNVAPLQALESEKMMYVSDKKTHTYFRISEQACYSLSAQPGDLLRVVVRPEYTQKDLSTTQFRLSLKINDTLVHTYSFRSKRCEKVVYENNLKLIHGTLTELYIKIPKKKLPNRQMPYYSICLLEKNKTALVKVSKMVEPKTIKSTSKKRKQLSKRQKRILFLSK